MKTNQNLHSRMHFLPQEFVARSQTTVVWCKPFYYNCSNNSTGLPFSAALLFSKQPDKLSEFQLHSQSYIESTGKTQTVKNTWIPPPSILPQVKRGQFQTTEEECIRKRGWNKWMRFNCKYSCAGKALSPLLNCCFPYKLFGRHIMFVFT